VKVLDLFSGIGGFSLGLERAGMETVAFCEIDPFCRRVLCEHWPDVPIFEDIRELDTKMVGPVDVVTGGFPCQPFSTASRGRRVAVDVWGHMLRVVNEILPTWVLAENVLGLGLDGVDRVVADLTDSGYTTTVTDIDVAPPHRSRGRFRYLFVAHSDRKGQPRLAFHEEMAGDGTPDTTAQFACRPNGGSLNPTWVEWLMGFPLEWTACEAWETRSSRKSRKSSGEQ
jgi:DNA (cytosine-5)-methyltransferase 1